MEPDNPRMVMFHNEFCNHAENVGMNITDILRHLLPDNVEGLCQSYFENEAHAMQYLCAIGIERKKVRDYLGVAAKMFILCSTYSGETLRQACIRVAEEGVQNGMDGNILTGLGALRGVAFALEPRSAAPEGEERTPARPVEPEPAPRPVVEPEPDVDRRLWKEAVLKDARAKARSRLLRSRGSNICCGVLAQVETDAEYGKGPLVWSRAWWHCPRCGRNFGTTSEYITI